MLINTVADHFRRLVKWPLRWLTKYLLTWQIH